MKAYRLFVILLVVIIALPLAGRVFWLMKKSKPINILIINKSVQKSSQNEVKAVNWILNYEKFVDSDYDLYDFEIDYMGYFPDAISEDRKVKSFKLDEIPSLSENKDALFFIDNAGAELNLKGGKNSGRPAYGGFNQNDYFLLKEMVNKKKLVVAEYNFFAPPTEELVRYNTEQFLDLYSLGWTGKFFDNLAKERIKETISINWFDLYKQNYSVDWDYSGPGIVLLNPGQNRILVLPSSNYMDSEYPSVITSPELAAYYNVPLSVSYDGWFDIPFEGSNLVISHMDMNLNQDGVDLLRKNGIDSKFPIVIQSKNKKFYYMGGDFSKEPVSLLSSRYGFISTILRNVEGKNALNPRKFYPVYYSHLLAGILNDYYSGIPEKKN